MLSKLFIVATVVLSSYNVFAGDTVVRVEHGDGHVDNTQRMGVGHGFMEDAHLHHDKVHSGRGISNQHLDSELADYDHEDVGLGEHQHVLHEEGEFYGHHGADFGAHN